MTKEIKNSPSWEQRNLTNTKRLAIWTGAWLLTMALTNFGPTFLWQNNNHITVFMIGVNVFVGFAMIWANKIQLQGLDELQQRVQLEAMGLSLGVGLVLGLAYSNLAVTNIIATEAKISYLVIIMGLTYLIGILLGLRKYQ